MDLRNQIFVPEGFCPVGEHADRLARLADELMFKTMMNEKTQSGHWVDFGNRDWKRIKSDKYGEVKEAAKSQGLIEVNEHYSSDPSRNSKGKSFPKSLRLKKGFRDALPVRYELRKKLKRRTPHQSNRLSESDVVGQWLWSKFEQVTGLDEESIVRFLSENDNPLSRFAGIRACQKIEDRDFFICRCDYGRVHSNFTQLSKSLRKDLRYADETLIGIDVANCQPALLPVVLYQHDSNNDEKERDRLSEFLETSRGQFYEKVAEILDMKGASREELKVYFFESIYGQISTTKGSKLFQILRAEFPRYMELLIDIKRSNHCELARRLQKLESQIIIDTCCVQLMNVSPEIPIITIHDEILTTRKFADVVSENLKQSFKDQIGLIVKIKSSMKGKINEICNQEDWNT